MAMNRKNMNRNNIPRGELICRKEDFSPFGFGVVFFYDIRYFSDPDKQKVIENIWSREQRS